MAKTYKVEETTRNSGWWHWYCKNDTKIEGWTPSKKSAQKEAKKNCDTHGVIVPPPVEIYYLRGYLAVFAVKNLDGEKQKFSVGEIDETTFDYIFGFEDDFMEKLNPENIVIGVLKIWGIYKGGVSYEQILRNHNLSNEEYDKLFYKNWIGLIIDIDDYGTIHWTFSDYK